MRHAQEPEDFIIKGGQEEGWLKRNNVRLAEVILAIILLLAIATALQSRHNGQELQRLEQLQQCDPLMLT
jgi:hypothetical protein